MMRDSPLVGLWIGARLDHRVAAATIRADKMLYQGQIKATDAEIDTPV